MIRESDEARAEPCVRRLPVVKVNMIRSSPEFNLCNVHSVAELSLGVSVALAAR
jgi:hypothetical protein